MNYLLKLFDLPLLKFSVVEDLATPVLEILWINEEKRNLLPLDMEPTSDGLANWMCRRAIPKNRAFVHALLAKCNLNAGNVSSNSMFVANDEKQREKMTAEFYMNYKRDIETYEERIQHFIDNGCSSAAVINRWLKKIEALKAKKTTYEQVLKRRLDDLDKDFSLLQMQSQELSLRAVKNQMEMPLAA